MDEAVGILFFGIMVLILIGMLLVAQSAVTAQSAEMKEKLTEERLRSKEGVQLAWLDGDELMMVNTGPREVEITHVYYYEKGRRVPSGYAEVSITLAPGESKVVEIEKLRYWPTPAEMIPQIPKTPGGEYIICHDDIYENHLAKKDECFLEPETQFPSIDRIDYGIVGYALYRGSGSSTLEAELPYGDTNGDGVMEGYPPYTWAVCSWLRMEHTASTDFPLLVVDPNYGEIDPDQRPVFELRYDPTMNRIYARIRTDDPSIGTFDYGRSGSNPANPESWSLYCLTLDPNDPQFTSYKVRFYVNTTLVDDGLISGLPTDAYGWGIWYSKVYELYVRIPSGNPVGYWLEYIFVSDIPLNTHQVNILYKMDWFPIWAATWSFDFIARRPITGAKVVTNTGMTYESHKIGVPVRGAPQLMEFETVNEYGCFAGCIWSCYGGGCYWTGWGG